MMPADKLARMVVANATRSPKHFVLSAFGIVIGIGAFVFFLAGTLGISDVLLGKVFPLDQVEVIAPHTSIAGKNLSQKLTAETVATIKSRAEVKEALPRMTLQFPATGYGKFEGQEIKFEVGGFTDGIPDVHVADDPKLAGVFKDWSGDPADNGPACVPHTPNACPDTAWQYCDEMDKICRHRVPVIISPTVLELYNTQVADSHGLPHIGVMEQFIAERGRDRMHFWMGLGSTMMAGSNVAIDPNKYREIGAILVGVSPKARRVGLTIPIGYVERWNRSFVGDKAAAEYSSIIVTLRDKDKLATFAQWLQDEPKLKLEDQLGSSFATVIFVIRLVLLGIAFVIVIISAINIAHNFFMQVSERRREIGVLRAVGATRQDVMWIILGESAIIGVVSGVIGSLMAYLGSLAVDWMLNHVVGNFPFKPDTLFRFTWWNIGSAIGLSILFCVLGGLLPALRASRLEPATALAQT
ncbi:MAG: ABC transporter permease [Myxococcales bacterium]|nr:ABC transporter permease [Myxococcales bacterium]